MQLELSTRGRRNLRPGCVRTRTQMVDGGVVGDVEARGFAFENVVESLFAVVEFHDVDEPAADEEPVADVAAAVR